VCKYNILILYLQKLPIIRSRRKKTTRSKTLQSKFSISVTGKNEIDRRTGRSWLIAMRGDKSLGSNTRSVGKVERVLLRLLLMQSSWTLQESARKRLVRCDTAVK
jgi:hypothetical protein